MNPLPPELVVASLPLTQAPASKAGGPGTGKTGEDFFSLLQGLAKSTQKRAFSQQTEGPRITQPLQEDYVSYLEYLRKGLLANGKALDKLSLTQDDLPLITKFLRQCGFSQEQVRKLLGELLENNPSGKVSLSQLFMKLDDLGPPAKKSSPSVTLESSAIPYMESILDQIGLTPREVDDALTVARSKDGGLDVNRLITYLRGLKDPIQEKAGTEGHQDSSGSISKQLERLGIQLPNQEGGRPISIGNLVKALEGFTGQRAEADQLPKDVKKTIDDILKRLVTADQKEQPPSIMTKLRPSQLPSEGGTDSFPSSGGGKIERETKMKERERSISLFDKTKTGKAVESEDREDFISSMRQKDGMGLKTKFISDVDGDARGLRRPQVNLGTSEKETARPVHTSIPGLSEPASTTKLNQTPLRLSIPTQVIDQIGKQIARSILRGDRVVRLQLRPPDLGVLKVAMDMKDNVLKLGMIAENSSVKDLLLSNAHALRDALVQQGIKLDRLDVQINYHFGQSLADLKEGQRDRERSVQGISETPGTQGDDIMEDLIRLTPTLADSNRLLDLVA